MVVDLHRDHAGLVGNVAADHQHYTEFTDGMREPEDRRGYETGTGQRQDHAEKSVPGIGAQGRGHFQWAGADGRERVLQRLHHKRHGIDHRTDHQPGKAEGQRAQAQPLREVAEKAIGPHCQQQIEADHGRRQHKGQGDDCANGAAQPGTTARQPQGNRSADDQQDRGGQGRQFQGQPDRREVGTRE